MGQFVYVLAISTDRGHYVYPRMVSPPRREGESMTRDELKEKIANMIRDTTYRNPQMFVKHGDVSLFSTRLAKRILALINSQGGH